MIKIHPYPFLRAPFYVNNHCSPNKNDISGALCILSLSKLILNTKYEGAPEISTIFGLQWLYVHMNRTRDQRINLRSIRDLCHFEIEFQTEKEQ